jgi:spore coat polysaccharide biosynthesis predicted glycosyltransferase SpsG
MGSVVVSMGGSDTYGLTLDVVRALSERKLAATVVIGPGFAHEAGLAKLLDIGMIVKRSIPSLAEEFSRHDLAITAGGITPFEANAAGLPCVVIGAEPWEERAGELLAKLGGCRYAGPRARIDFSPLDHALPLEKMSAAALAAVPVDGAERVAAELLKL